MPHHTQQIARPFLFWKILGVVGSILLTIITIRFILNPLSFLKSDGVPPSPRQFWVGILVFGPFLIGMACLCWWLFYESFVQYSWDDEVISRKTILGRRSLRWIDVVHFRVWRPAGGHIIYLYDTSGERLKVDIQLIGEDHSLHGMIEEKLSGLIHQSSEFIHPETTPIFHFRVLGIKIKSIRLGVEGITERRLLTTRTVRYDEIQSVRQLYRYQHGVKSGEAYILNDGRRDRFHIPDLYENSETLIEFLKKRINSAVWVNVSQPNSEYDSRQACIYLLHHLTIKRSNATTGLLLVVIASPYLIIHFTAIARQGAPFRMMMLQVLILSGALLYIAFQALSELKNWRAIRRELEKLRPLLPEDWRSKKRL